MWIGTSNQSCYIFVCGAHCVLCYYIGNLQLGLNECVNELDDKEERSGVASVILLTVDIK